MTQPNLMILVSFSSAEDALSNDVQKYDIFSSQGTENPPFRFFWDTRYRTKQFLYPDVTSYFIPFYVHLCSFLEEFVLLKSLLLHFLISYFALPPETWRDLLHFAFLFMLLSTDLFSPRLDLSP